MIDYFRLRQNLLLIAIFSMLTTFVHFLNIHQTRHVTNNNLPLRSLAASLPNSSSLATTSNKLVRLHYLSTDRLQVLIQDKISEDDLKKDLITRENVNLIEVESLMNQLSVTEWRKKRSSEIREAVSLRIHKLQNPTNCSNVQYVYCSVSKYGFTSQIHRILFCFVRAYYESRMVILNINSGYFHDEPWTAIFQPLSDPDNNCLLNFNLEKARNVVLENEERGHRRLLGQLPKEYAQEIVSITNEPMAWFHSIFIKYIMRLSPSMTAKVDQVKKNLNFSPPIVGLHIRRGDKLQREARKHEVSEYMKHASNFFEKLQLFGRNVDDRKIFVATDDPSALRELELKYRNYTILSNEAVAKEASKLHGRYSSKVLDGIVMDLNLLGHTDFIIGTFSSGVSRLGLELLLARDPTSLHTAVSLDVPFRFDRACNPERIAVYNYNPERVNEWSLKSGEIMTDDTSLCSRLFWWLRQARDTNVTSGYYRAMKKGEKGRKYLPAFLTVPLFPN